MGCISRVMVLNESTVYNTQDTITYRIRSGIYKYVGVQYKL